MVSEAVIQGAVYAIEGAASVTTLAFSVALVWLMTRRGLAHPVVCAWQRYQVPMGALALAASAAGAAIAGDSFGEIVGAAAGLTILFGMAAAAVPSVAAARRPHPPDELVAIGYAIATLPLLVTLV